MRTSIYLPDALAEQVKAHGISLSEVTQAALREAVRRAEIKEKVMSNLQAVAERLRTTIDQADQEKRQDGHEDGIAWAKEYATAIELENIHNYNFSTGVQIGGTILDFLSARDGQVYISAQVDDAEGPYWEGFVEGAEEVWEAVRLLI